MLRRQIVFICGDIVGLPLKSCQDELHGLLYRLRRHMSESRDNLDFFEESADFRCANMGQNEA